MARMTWIAPARRVRLASVVALVAWTVASCGKDATGPSGAATDVAALNSTTLTGTAGLALPAPIVVTVTDAASHPVRGATVTFDVTDGLGSTSPQVGTTDSKGQASTTRTIGTAAGTNVLVASVEGVDKSITFVATGIPGPAVALAVSPKTLRIGSAAAQGKIRAQVVDQFGNATATVVTLVSLDPTKVTVDQGGTVRVVQRGTPTYVVATSGAFRDSALVVVLNPGDPACTGLPTVGPIDVGQVLTVGFQDQGICVIGGGEYVLSPFFNSAAPSAETEVDVLGDGISAPGALPALAAASRSPNARSLMQLVRAAAPANSFHDQLRAREERLMPAYVAGARAWYAQRKSGASNSANALTIPSQAKIGDLISLNADAVNFCSDPSMRTGRVAAITDKAIVVADTANPVGGFTDAEYASIGATFDTLNYSTDVANFGEPSDIDGNKHVVLFFTHAVNELSSGSGSVTLGFYYSRDLLPKTGPMGACPGSNVGEMFYLAVPDPNGEIPLLRSKSDVVALTSGTVAHEFQHLINASRRLYVNNAPVTTEERWLNEGLSHIAEELNFYSSSKLTPQQNLGSIVTSAADSSAFNTYGFQNFIRLNSYLGQTETQGPIGTDDNDDDLATRGAIWSFLRYAADRTNTAANQHNFWFQLVNSQTTGVANLTAVIGSDPKLMMRDWSLATFSRRSGADPVAVPAAELELPAGRRGDHGAPVFTRAHQSGAHERRSDQRLSQCERRVVSPIRRCDRGPGVCRRHQRGHSITRLGPPVTGAHEVAVPQVHIAPMLSSLVTRDDSR